MTCGEKITELRKKANITQQQLGDELNVSAQAVSKWEHNLAEPDVTTIKKICLYFKISTDEFFGIEKEKPEEKPEEKVEEKKEEKPAPAPAPVVIVKHTPQKEFLGVCTRCGVALDKSNVGVKAPKMYCQNCYADMLAEQEMQKRRAAAEVKQRRRDSLNNATELKNKSIRWGLLITIPIFIINLLVLIFGKLEPTYLAVYAPLTVFGGYAIYALVADYIIHDGIVGDILEFFICAPIKFPGIIFSFDLSGFIFLIALKILFAILGFIIGVILFFVGVGLGSLVAAFVFPFHMAKLNNEIKTYKE